jgi:hypothetical protein
MRASGRPTGLGSCAGLAAAEREMAMAQGKAIEVVRLGLRPRGGGRSKGERFLLACAMLPQGHDKSGHMG